jgi:hypothetical protein
LTPPDPYSPAAERRLVPRWFQPLHLSSEKPVSKFAFQMGQLAPLQRGPNVGLGDDLNMVLDMQF